MEITRDQILQLAKLSRFELSPASVDQFQISLTRLLDYVSQLDQVDTTGIEPTFTVNQISNVWREDVLTPQTVSPLDLIGLAPAVEGRQIKVPKVL